MPPPRRAPKPPPPSIIWLWYSPTHHRAGKMSLTAMIIFWDRGAGFYLTATQSPWAPHFAMDRYITEELPDLINTALGRDISSRGMGITGHSMGGHGALTLAMKHPHLFRSVSAFAPISSAMASGWGQNVLPVYLGMMPPPINYMTPPH